MIETEWSHLLAALHGENVDQAVAAALALAELTDEHRIPDLKSLMQDQSFFVREAAAEPLARLEGARALPLLFEALTRGIQEGHDNDGLCSTLAALLNAVQLEAIPLLLEMLHDERAAVRQNAVWALGFVAHNLAPLPLMEALHDQNPGVRAAAAGSLASFKGDRMVMNSLLSLLSDPDEQVRVSTIASLGYLGDPRAVPDLRKALQDPADRVRTFAAHALSQLGTRHP